MSENDSSASTPVCGLSDLRKVREAGLPVHTGQQPRIVPLGLLAFWLEVSRRAMTTLIEIFDFCASV